jgi:hypothetical protein
VNLPETRSVAGSHILVEGIDGGNTRHLTVLLVHVVGAGAGVVADPDTEVLDFLGALLVDLRHVSCQPYSSADPKTVLRFEYLWVRTWFTETISPLAFLILRSLPRKYQNRDLAMTSLGANMRMR